MDELSILKELELNSHIEIAGSILLFSFLVKVLYQDHIQKFLKDIRSYLSNKKAKQAEVPSIYEMLPPNIQRKFDYIEIVWSYSVAVICLLYFLALLVMSNDTNLFKLPLLNITLYFSFVFLILIICFSAVKNGNKVVYAIKMANKSLKQDK